MSRVEVRPHHVSILDHCLPFLQSIRENGAEVGQRQRAWQQGKGRGGSEQERKRGWR